MALASGQLTRIVQLTPALALLLSHDLLLSKGGVALPKDHGLRVSIERHKGRLTSELTRARLRRKAPSLDLLREQVGRDAAGEEANYPRWVRVNTIKSTVEEQLETTFAGYARASTIAELMKSTKKHLLIDPHVPNLLSITSGVDLTKTPAYAEGKIILQDKASCFPAYLLDPRAEDGDVVDACAAPGNKTTHLAAILHEHRPDFEAPPQAIYAFEKDSRRAGTLTKMVKVAGSHKNTKVGFGQDFLQVKPKDEAYKAVGALLLDPSCSGSGIVGRDSMPEVHLPEGPGASNKGEVSAKKGSGDRNDAGKKRKTEEKEKQEDVLIDDDGNETVVKSERDLEARLEALAGFQLTLLLHAFKFPAAKRITYSTCSVHSQENEHVVMKALASKVAQRRGWRVLRRDEQVRGMEEWPVRGLKESCDGDEVAAEGCIRSYKDDGMGVMGFFVAGFVRDGSDEDEEGPYVRDDDGAIVRDVAGMPVLKATGEAVSLQPRDESPEQDEEEHEEEDASSDDSDGEWGGFDD